MDGDSHLIHYELLFHALGRESRFRPYAAAGGGIRLFRGTGKEYANQPFSDFAVITKANEIKPLISAGGGVKFSLSPSVQLRLEAHDFLTPFPKSVIAPAPGSTIGGWLQDFVVMAGLSFTF